MKEVKHGKRKRVKDDDKKNKKPREEYRKAKNEKKTVLETL